MLIFMSYNDPTLKNMYISGGLTFHQADTKLLLFQEDDTFYP